MCGRWFVTMSLTKARTSSSLRIYGRASAGIVRVARWMPDQTSTNRDSGRSACRDLLSVRLLLEAERHGMTRVSCCSSSEQRQKIHSSRNERWSSWRLRAYVRTEALKPYTALRQRVPLLELGRETRNLPRSFSFSTPLTISTIPQEVQWQFTIAFRGRI